MDDYNIDELVEEGPKLLPEHAQHLAEHGIDLELARSLGVRSVVAPDDLPTELMIWGTRAVPGILFPWTIGDAVWHQVRPDDPIDGRKYVSGEGSGGMIWEVWRPVVAELVLLIEGTKQALAVASTRPPYRVYAMAGVEGWSRNGAPSPHLAQIAEGRPLVAVIDADMSSNPNVWRAAKRMVADLPPITLSSSFGIARTPGSRVTGIDDYLAGFDDAIRPKMLSSVLATATSKIGPEPKGDAIVYDGLEDVPRLRGKLEPTALALHLDARRPYATDNGFGNLWLYDPDDGTYKRQRNMSARFAHELGDAFLDVDEGKTRAALVAVAKLNGRVIDFSRPPSPLIAVANGVLDPDAGELVDNDPEHLVTARWPVVWDPDAECPTILEYLESKAPGRVDVILDTMARLVDRDRTAQDRALLLFGPTRSGKTTIASIFEELVGHDARSAVSLEQLETNRFAPADLLGKTLNLADDISSETIRDGSAFKTLTGGGVLRSEQKYADAFPMRFHGVMLFTANEIPAIEGSSSAERARLVPVHVDGETFAGAEDESIKQRLYAELPGLLVELVRRHRAGRTPTPLEVDRLSLDMAADRVAHFAAEMLDVLGPDDNADDGDLGTEVYSAFSRWLHENGFARAMSRPTFYRRLADIGIGQDRGPAPKRRRVVRARLRGSRNDGQKGQDHLSLRVRSEKSIKRDIGEGDRENALLPSIVFDLETGPAGRLFDLSDPEWLRIAGVEGAPTGAEAIRSVVELASRPDGPALVAHNGYRFDFVALAHRLGVDLFELAEAGRLIDTRVLARLADPPPDRKKKGDPRLVSGYYGLDAVADRLGVAGKSGDLRALAREFSPNPRRWEEGLDRIPLDDERYLAYCTADVEANRRVLDRLDLDDYGRREMRLLGRLVHGITVVGMRVDLELLDERLAEVDETKRQARETLVELGLPATTATGEPASNPVSCSGGKDRIVELLADYGVPVDRLDRTPTGEIATGSDPMAKLLDHLDGAEHAEEIRRLVDAVVALQSARSVYGTIDRFRVGDRVHPILDAGQASGRFSIRDPGLTVLGKRDGRYVERDLLLGDDDDHLVMAFDLAQIDSRAVAALSQCPDYIDLFVSGRDIHAEVQAALGLDKRDHAKPFSHGYPYGITVSGMVRQGLDAELSERFLEFMHDSFPRMAAWMEEMRDHAQTVELLDNGFGRMMRPDSARSYTQGPALMGQGCARDLTAEVVLRLEPEVARMVRMWAHDELVFSVPAGEVDAVSDEVLRAMSFEWRGVPIVGDPSVAARSWGGVYGT